MKEPCKKAYKFQILVRMGGLEPPRHYCQRIFTLKQAFTILFKGLSEDYTLTIVINPITLGPARLVSTPSF